MENPAAWHPDPTGRHEHRWWDGERWTEHVADAGQSSVDPLEGGAAATPDDTSTTPTGRDDAATSADADPSAQTTPSWDQPTADQPGQAGGWDQSGSGGQPGGWDQPGPGSGEQAGGWDQPGGQQPSQQGWNQPGTGQPAGQAGWGSPQPGGPGEQPWSQQGWPQATPASQGPQVGTPGLAITALILGILSMLFFWVPLLGGLGALVAILFGFLGRSQANKRGSSGKGLGIAGIVTGILALLGNILITLFIFGVLAGGDVFGGWFGDYVECMEQYDDEEFCEQHLPNFLTE